MNYIEYLFFRGLRTLISIIPFSLLFVLSDISSFFLQYIFCYRLSTVSDNLKNAFPEKSYNEIRIVTRSFYKHLCDVTLESIKGYSLSTKQLLKRYRILNPEVVNQYYEKEQNIIIAMSHYGNWEWGTQVAGSYFEHKLISLYKPLSNKYTEEYIRDLRMRRNMEFLSIYDAKYIFRSKGSNPKIFFFVGDQSPSNIKKVVWIKFFNQDTACLRRIENYARLFNLLVIYADIQKVKRGYYTVEMQEICSNASETLPGEITDRYMRKLESIIIKKPEDWLWSHRRWKLIKHLTGINKSL
jgi:Kdo2-lipid IVA lauroyltransferase/acyltransferase